VTAEEAGTLARADTTTVVYDGTGGRVGGGPAGSGPVTGQSGGEATVARIGPTQDCTADPAACEPTTTSTEPTTTTTTEPPPQTVPSLVPDDTLPPDDMLPPDDTLPPADTLPPDDRGADLGDGSETPTGAPTATLTELLPIGSVAERGSVLYRADHEPIVALFAATPLFRDLTTGVEGPDVQALEENLVALGYGSGVDVDEDFDRGTAAAVRAWEEDLGRAASDGVVTVGEVVFLQEAAAVLGHEAAVGDLLESGDAVLELGAESRVVEADVAAVDVADWPVGTQVTLDWGDGTTGTGTVTEVSRDVVADEVALVVTIADGGGTDRPVGSRVDVVRTVVARSGVVAVPVGAVVAGPAGPAVRVVGTGSDRRTTVELGIVDDGWVEVVSGLDEGTEVRLPG
ncbi:MAG TPA: peptidoglycan-binding domain-containing protein, partial [Acidimicrobiales bacterium]|nr:peptidoglycan-binding domain-containing protein [Acidimicrobiales bacterium]